MKITSLALVLLLATDVSGQKNVPAQITELQHRYDKAIEQKDSLTLRELFHPAMVITGGDGTRRDAITEIQDCIDPAYNVVYFRTQAIEVDVFGAVAILRGDIEWQLKSGDRPPLTLKRRITFIYAQTKKQWKIIAQHIGMSPKG